MSNLILSKFKIATKALRHQEFSLWLCVLVAKKMLKVVNLNYNILNDFPIFSKRSIAQARSSLLCAAESITRMRALPMGTVG